MNNNVNELKKPRTHRDIVEISTDDPTCCSISSTNSLIVKAIGSLFDLASDNIFSRIKITTDYSHKDNSEITSVKRESSPSEINNIIIVNKNTMEIIEVQGSDSNHLCELINLLQLIIDMDIIMNTEMYKRFRSKFTDLYYKAYFNGLDMPKFSLDTDEINQVLSFRKFDYKIIIQKGPNGRLFFRLIKNDEKITDNQLLNYLEEFDSSYVTYKKHDKMTDEIESLVKTFYDLYNPLTNNEYRVFTTGFKKIYNSYVVDKYEKISLNNINNILAHLQIPYEITRKKEFYRIVRTKEEGE